MWGIGRGFVLIQDGGDRSCKRKDFWVHFGQLERTQVFTGICGIHFIVIQINGFKKANALKLRVHTNVEPRSTLNTNGETEN